MVRLHTCLLVVSSVVLAQLFGCGAPNTGGDLFNDAGEASTGIDGGGGGGGGPNHDAGQRPETGIDAGVGSCSPGSLASFIPEYNLPVGPYAGACTEAQLEDAVSFCFPATATTKTQSECSAWLDDKANTACLDCWSGPVTSKKWAPILFAENGGQEAFVNLAGCIALADPSQLPCAQAFEYQVECELAACLAACPIPASNDTTAVDNCIGETDMDMNGCAPYLAKTGSAGSYCDPPDSGMNIAGFCYGAALASPPIADDLLRFFKLSCGPYPDTGDAGEPPPPSDAGSAPDGH